MQTGRQVASAFLIAIASLLFVVGGISLVLAEGGEGIRVPPATMTLPSTPAPTQTLQPGVTQQATLTPTVSPTSTLPGAPTACPAPAGWMPYTVQPGDTLELIALEYNTSVETLKSGNCLVSNDLPAGSIIYVPAKATQPVVPTATIRCGAPSWWVIYIVRSGDTLYSIAAAYRTTVPQLLIANCLTSSALVPGQQLYVPNVPTSTPQGTLPGIMTPTWTPTLPATTVAPTATNTLPPTETSVPTVAPPPTETTAPSATPTSIIPGG